MVYLLHSLLGQFEHILEKEELALHLRVKQ